MNNRGAVMVMGTFAGVFLVAVLYHLVGVGGAALENQLVQDSADGVAYSAAAVKARGMNIISLINLVMAAVLSVLVAIRLVQVIIGVAIAAVGVACFVTGGVACGAVAPLVNAQVQLHKLGNDLEPSIQRILQGLEKAAEAVNRTVPVLAEAEAVYISRNGTPGPAELGFAWPLLEELPTRKGSFDTLCEKAGEQVVRATTFFLPGDLPQKAEETVGKLVGGMASSFSSFFCGGSKDPPQSHRKTEVAYPIKNHPECDSPTARPSPSTGECYTDLCRRCARFGCADCLSRLAKSGYMEGQWQVREDTWVDVVYPDGHTSRLIEGSSGPSLETLKDNPCNNGASCGGDRVCEREVMTPQPGYAPAVATRVVKTSYRALYGCVVEEKVEQQFTGETLEADEWPVPRELDGDRLPEGSRVFGVVFGGTNRSNRLGRVGLGQDHEEISVPGRIGFAGADFGSSHKDLWHMDWRSRLIRFRFPQDGMGSGNDCSGAFQAECSKVQSRMGPLQKMGKMGEEWILH